VDTRLANVVLLVSLVALWVACTALHVAELAGGRLGWVGVYVTAAPGADGFPTVSDFWPGASPDASGDLIVGDQLLDVGGAALQGVGPIGFAARVIAASTDGRATIAYVRDGAAHTTTIARVPLVAPWRMLPLTCMLALSGTLVLVRRPSNRVSRAFFLAAMAYGLHWTFFFGGPLVQTYAWTIVFFCASLAMLPLILRAALIFPAEVAPPSGRLPWWPWLFALFGPISLSWLYGVPLPPELGFRAVFIVNVAFIVTLLAILTRNFRRAGAFGRRQLRWVILGMYVGTAPVLLTDVLAAVDPSFWWLHEIAVIAEIFIPVGMLIAIIRANYFDVDTLITGTAVYSVLSILLLAAALIAVPHLARAASRAAGFDPHAMQWGLALLVAAATVPASRLLSPRIERVLFHERHALRAGVRDLLGELAAAPGPDRLLTLVGERLDALVRPRACVIYAPLDDEFVPVFVRGAVSDDAPPAVSAATAAWLAARLQGPVFDLTRAVIGSDDTLPDDARVALASVPVAALLPVRRGADLAALICLDAKRSGDIYTATDSALLNAVADKVSGELLRFDSAVILQQERKMGEALRRYVPEPVAARLSRGQAVEGGERDVSVLFVDLRGYTTYSEAQAAGAVFSLINRYTETVSAVIQRRGGTVVEFLGDGLMAVFGAPEALPDHARVSVEAACEVVAAVRKLAFAADAPTGVGVGIASGRAFVGNIRTSDRFVYTAIGDVVNLASRIQGLTRELHAAVAIDASTHRTAGRSAAFFRRHERVHIRGRSEPVDVYALPSAAA
jgi:class 3 adenylate cyclase